MGASLKYENEEKGVSLLRCLNIWWFKGALNIIDIQILMINFHLLEYAFSSLTNIVKIICCIYIVDKICSKKYVHLQKKLKFSILVIVLF